MKTALEIAVIVVIGSVAGAELGSWCCVQPIVARLPYEQSVALEQTMLRTFGRVMPVLMPLSGILAVAFLIVTRADAGVIRVLRITAVVCVAVTIITTLIVNVPINNRTAEWSLDRDPAEWQRMRARWHNFQGVRGGLYLTAFILLVTAAVVARR